MVSAGQSLVKTYRRRGYCVIRGVFSAQDIGKLRKAFNESLEISSLYENSDRITVTFEELSQKLDHNPVLQLFLDPRLSKAVEPFRIEFGSELLPPFEMMRNFIKKRNTSSWHRDCGGEEKYLFCQSKLRSKLYMFSKIGIYLQPATEFGGTIKVVPFSHKVFSGRFSSIKQKISLGLLVLISKSLFSRKLFDFLLSKDLEIELGDVVLFDARLLHAGKSVSKEVEQSIQWVSDKTPNLPVKHTKYALYSHFGNSLGHESYLFDRFRISEDVRSNTKRQLDQFAEDLQTESMDVSHLEP